MTKRLVNGVETDLSLSGAKVQTVGDRLMVLTPEGRHTAIAVRRGDVTYVSYLGRQYSIEPIKAAKKGLSRDHSGELTSPMPGAVVDILVSEGQSVKKGDKIVILEAMKTQQAFLSPFDGKVTKLSVSKGEQVSDGVIMAVIEPVKE